MVWLEQANQGTSLFSEGAGCLCVQERKRWEGRVLVKPVFRGLGRGIPGVRRVKPGCSPGLRWSEGAALAQRRVRENSAER